MIRKVYETDPLLCPRCGGEMRIIAFIEDRKVIDRIIRGFLELEKIAVQHSQVEYSSLEKSVLSCLHLSIE